MSINIDHNFTRLFGKNFEDVAQEQASKLRQAARELRVDGKDFTIERLYNPNNVLTPVSARHASTSISDMTHSRRTVAMRSYADAYMLDDEDQVRMFADPKSDYLRKATEQFNRTVDARLIEACLEDAYEGETGTTVVALPSAQKIAHGSTGLTLAKLKEAMKILRKGHVDTDRESLWLFTNAEGLSDLESENVLSSVDYVDNKVNVSGKIMKAAGFNIVHCEALTDYTGTSAASTNRPAIALTGSAIRLGLGMDVLTSAAREPMHNLNWLINIKTTFGAGRAHDEHVVDIRFQE